jgi:thioredoxin reductase
MTDKKIFDVIIIGGSYSGLSAAMSLGRSLRNVLIIDSAKPCNIQTPHSHNFITQDGEIPKVIAEKARAQVLKYKTIEIINALATQGKRTDEGFEITTGSNHIYTSKKLIFATGLKDIMPDINGYKECWGISILHCPYCHGYEVKNLKTGIIANGDFAFEFAKMINHWTNDLTVFTNGDSSLSDEQIQTIERNKIKIIESEIDSIEHTSGQIRSIVFKDKSSFELKALYARPDFVQHCDIPFELGCEVTDQGLLKVDMFQKTNKYGIFACGDNSNFGRAVSVSVASGTMAGASCNKELIDEEF